MKPTVTIIGTGRAARGIGSALQASGAAKLVQVVGRDTAKAQRLFATLGGAEPMATGSDWTLFAVNDDAVAESAERVAARNGPAGVAIHFSGAHGPELLTPLVDQGWQTVAAHPLTTFDGSTRSHLDGVPIAITTASAQVAQSVGDVFQATGAQPFAIDGQQRLLYHAAAVFVSNYTTVMFDCGEQLWSAAGLDADDALRQLGPLIEQTVANNFKVGPTQALTGPAARGDQALMQKQRDAIEQINPALAELYDTLAERAAQMAARRADED